MRYSGYACKDEDQIDGKKRTTSMYFISFCCPRNLQQTQLNQLAFNIYTDFPSKILTKNQSGWRHLSRYGIRYKNECQ